jgi:hypothetical protein
LFGEENGSSSKKQDEQKPKRTGLGRLFRRS